MTLSDFELKGLRRFMERSGVAAELQAEAAADRAARAAEARKTKGKAVARFIKERDRVGALLKAAEDRQEAARKAADKAVDEWIKLRSEFSTLHDEIETTTKALDPVLRENADPAIDAEIAKCRELLVDVATIPPMVPDPKGTAKDPNGVHYRSRQPAIDARHRSIVAAIDALEFLKVDPDGDDVPGRIESIRATILEV